MMTDDTPEDPAILDLELEMLQSTDKELKWLVLLAGRELSRRGLAQVKEGKEN
jgi:hypothetical protein